MLARRLRALLCAAFWPSAALAAFDSTDVVQIQASIGYTHDNSLFRLPDLDPRPFGTVRVSFVSGCVDPRLFAAE